MALFKTIAEIKGYLGAIQKNLDLNTILSYVTEAELLYIEPFLGTALYDSLSLAYQNNSLTPQQTKLLLHVQRPLAHLTFHQYASIGNLFISDLGFQQTSTDNTSPAPQWAVNKVMEYTQKTADSFLDKLIFFLEKNKGDYSEWLTSDFYKLNRELLINSTAELQTRIFVENSRLFFWHLRTYLRLAEHKYIANTISQIFLDELKSKAQNDTLTVPEKKVMEMCKDALAHYAIYEALPGLSVAIAPNSIRATIFNDSFKQTKPADMDIMQMLKTHYEQNAKSYLTELKKYLDLNPDTFPLYRDSGKYIAPPTTKHYEQTDNEDSTLFYIK